MFIHIYIHIHTHIHPHPKNPKQTGLRELLEQPLAHPVLKQALPLAAPLLHDKTPRVRAAFVGLLQRVKVLGVRDIRFYEVVPVEQLLARCVFINYI